ncbi:MAG TPA: tetratricopeptide repeat protein [Terriglobales bacterium]|nr:tetratricopeptide repeat protein [Terriglobales bacterium]
MTNEIETAQPSTPTWQSKQVYAMAIACLVVGLVIGYFLRGSQTPVADTHAQPTAQQAVNPHAGVPGMGGGAPTMEQMKQMAEKTAQPIKEELKTHPKNFDALNKMGNVYRATHQFKEAAEYYTKALEVDPKNAAVRTDLATCLYYTGDVDGAVAQLEKALSYDPKFAGALYNLGMIKLKGKKDSAGAIASWQKLLKVVSDPAQKQQIEDLIAKTKNTKDS